MNLDRFKCLFDLNTRVSVVTGAGQGNGMGIANALHDAGSRVIATDIFFPDDCLLNSHIERYTMDVTNEKSVLSVFENIVNKYEKIDILINNAGIIYKSAVDEIDIVKFQNVMNVNLNGTVLCTKNVIPYMKKNNWGRIVNISSSQAFLNSEGYSAYSASKVSVTHLTRIWALELAEYGIIVNALCPSFIMTPMMKNSISLKARKMNISELDAKESFISNIPLKCILSIEDMSNWVVVLCSKLSDITTGNNFSITGGQVRL